MVQPDDWRLQGQEGYLVGRELKWSAWRTTREGWDHDHCAFCWVKFGRKGAEGVDLSAGYVTADDEYHWVCEACFEDFRPTFQWAVQTE